MKERIQRASSFQFHPCIPPVLSLSCFWIYLRGGSLFISFAYNKSGWLSKIQNGSIDTNDESRGWINFLERSGWKERIRGEEGRREGGRSTGGNERKEGWRPAWIESIVGNREKYALIRAGAGNLWICGEPDAYRQWPTSRDSYNHRLLRCYSSTVNQVRRQFSSLL